MRLTATSHRGGSFAPTLAMPYPALENAGLRLRRGQTSLTVAAPGVGKSQLWANICQRGGFPTLYWSADTDRHDATTRSLAMWSGKTTDEIDTMLGDRSWDQWAEKTLASSRHVDFVFDTHITKQGLGERMIAFAELHGEYPHLLVIDNLSNTVTDPANEFPEQKEMVTAAQQMARDTGTHVAMLSHSKGQYENGSVPIPQGGSMNNLFKLAEVGVTLFRMDEDQTLGVNLVKLRSGKSDAGAKHPIVMQIDLARATVKGFRG